MRVVPFLEAFYLLVGDVVKRLQTAFAVDLLVYLRADLLTHLYDELLDVREHQVVFVLVPLDREREIL